jgi:hypothetical protein
MWGGSVCNNDAKMVMGRNGMGMHRVERSHSLLKQKRIFYPLPRGGVTGSLLGDVRVAQMETQMNLSHLAFISAFFLISTLHRSVVEFSTF